jgi:sulfur-oxidizing protein SoxZ
VNARLHLPARVRRGEEFQLRVILQHPMENGLRRGEDGRVIPYSVVERLLIRYNGAEVFAAEMTPGIAANPYLAVHLVAGTGGEVVVDWVTTGGERGSVAAAIAVD